MQMKVYTDNELRAAYQRGLDAGWRRGEYDKPETPQCPYSTYEETALEEAWHDGFGDGTEDYIAYQRSD